MPQYNQQHPGQRQSMPEIGHHHMSGKSFEELMDCVASDLYHGATWHGMAAPQMYKIGLRGFAHLHTYNAHHDFCKLYGSKSGEGGLLKILSDRLDMYPEIDASDIPKALAVSLNSPADLKPHLEMWCKNEEEFAHILTESVRKSATIDMCVYNELTCILSAVQEEIMRVKILKKRLALADYSGHDLGVVSLMLHRHFEHSPEKGLDFDV